MDYTIDYATKLKIGLENEDRKTTMRHIFPFLFGKRENRGKKWMI
jgi:hypothetical protein